MVEKNPQDLETRKVYLRETRQTQGWQILMKELRSIRESSVNRVLYGSPSNVTLEEVIVSRAEIRLIDRLFDIADPAKEDTNASAR